MRDFYKIAAQNIALWQAAAAENRTLRLLQFTQWGRMAAEDFAKGGFRDAKDLAPHLHAQFPTQTPEAAEQIAFCRGFLERYPQFLREEESAGQLPPAPAAPRVVFFDSFFSREALRRFEVLLPLPRPVTAPSFTAVCEELASDRADFALLPLEDTRKGKFLYVPEEAERFELRMTHTCDIPYPDETGSVTVALLAKLYQPTEKSEGEPLLSCVVPEEDHQTLCELLRAAECAGLSLRSIDSRPTPYGERGVYYQPVFRSTPQSEQLFESYLAIFHPRARVLGRYRHLT